MDRIHDHQIEEALRRALTEPTHAARYATTTADHLAHRDRADQPAVRHILPALHDAYPAALGNAPAAVRARAIDSVHAALPEPRDGETCGEYAIRLRDAAKGL